MKRGQISIFILIGVVVLIIVSFFLFLYSFSTETNVLSQTQNELANVQVLRNTIQSCLDAESEQAVYDLGLQGGNIYPHQGGSDDVISTLSYTLGSDSKFVNYGILRSDTETLAPYYPAAIASQQGNFYTLSFLEINYPGYAFWGKNNLRKLCEFDGANSFDNPDKKYSCEFFTYGEGDTIQLELTKAVSRNIISCVDRQKNELANQLGEFTYNISSLDIILGNEEVQVNLETNVFFSQKNIDAQFNELSYTIPVRLKRVYNLMYYLIEHEIRDIRFDKSEDYPDIFDCNYAGTSQCWDSQMAVSVYRGPNRLSAGHDIIEIIDNKSNSLGNPFRFLVAVENRRPMLDFFDLETSDLTPNVLLTEGDPVNLTPVGYDPDEDRLTYSYDSTPGWYDASSLESSDAYVSGVGCTQNSRCATLESNDTGVYSIDIVVSDESGLFDFQTLFVKSYGSGINSNGWYEDIDICPAYRDGYETKICVDDICECEQGEYCIDARPTQDTKLTCAEDAYCCAVKTTGDLGLTCEGDDSNCDANVDSNGGGNSGEMYLYCTGDDSTCRAQSTGTINRLCSGQNALCQIDATSVNSFSGDCVIGITCENSVTFD